MQNIGSTNTDLQNNIVNEMNYDPDKVEICFLLLEGKLNFIEVFREETSNNKSTRFLRRDEYIEILNTIMSSSYLDISEISSNRKRYEQIRKLYDIQKETEGTMDIVYQEDDEQNWHVNEELERYIYEDIPDNLKDEEKAIWIYIKLCKALMYDDTYFYGEKGKRKDIDIEFLESIKPGSEVLCYDFARIYAKLINSIPNKTISANIIGDDKHFLVSLISNEIYANIDATRFGLRAKNVNDLIRTKMSLPISGFNILYSINKDYEDKIRTICSNIYQDKDEDEITLQKYCKMLEVIRQDEIISQDPNKNKDDWIKRVEVLVNELKGRKIVGTEALQAFMMFIKDTRYFDKDVKWLTVAKRDDDKYRTAIILSKIDDDYCIIIDTKNMEIQRLELYEIAKKFTEKEYIHSDEFYGASNVTYIKDKINEEIFLQKEEA